jgi:hypothetical protein
LFLAREATRKQKQALKPRYIRDLNYLNKVRQDKKSVDQKTGEKKDVFNKQKNNGTKNDRI